MVLALKDTADFPIPTKNIVDNDTNFNYNTTDAINAYDRTYIDIVNANRTKFFPYASVMIERSTDAGSTWTTVDTSTISNTVRANLMSDVGGGNISIGTGNADINQQLRITLQYPGSGWYCSLDRAYFRFSRNGHTNTVTIEASTYGAQSTYTTLASNKKIDGWPGDNLVKFTEKTAWGTNKSEHLYNVRFTFKYASISSSYVSSQANIQKIDMFGPRFWGTTNSPQHYGHLYSWDSSKNVTYPAKVTSTNFTSPRFTATGTTWPHIAGNGTYLAISPSTSTGAGSGALSIGATEFRPFGAENGNISLGASSARWKNLYLSGTIGNGTYTYTLPSATGTLALTSDISTYNYSTTEQLIGTWIDGTNLYRKVIDCGAGPNNTNKAVSTGIPYTGTTFINLYGMAVGSSYSFPINNVRPKESVTTCIGAYITDNSGTADLTIIAGADRSGMHVYIVLEYAKSS